MRPIDADALHEAARLDCSRGNVIDHAEFDLISDYLASAPTLELERNWIPVEERMPENGVNVLLHYEDGEIDVDCHFSRCGFIGEQTFGRVTHWMPLPAPPVME